MTPLNSQPMPEAFAGSPNPNSPPMYIPSPYSQSLTQVTMNDDMYWKDQPLAVQALRGLAASQGSAAAAALAAQLAKENYAIDVLIMVYGASPTSVMIQRWMDGTTWVPRLGASDDFTNVLINPQAPDYDPTKPPADAILTSVSAASYPPAPGTITATPVVASTAVIGPQLPDGNFAPGPGTLNGLGMPKYNLGDTLQVNGHSYQLVRVGLFNSLEWKQLN